MSRDGAVAVVVRGVVVLVVVEVQLMVQEGQRGRLVVSLGSRSSLLQWERVGQNRVVRFGLVIRFKSK